MNVKDYIRQRLRLFVVNAAIFLSLLGIAIYFLGVPKHIDVPIFLLLIGCIAIELLEYNAWKNR